MSTAHGAAEYIYEGIWTDWSKGPILGSTLTVSPYHATILSPAIAIFVSIAGSQLWRLFQFGLHQARATKHPSDFLYHQQQVVLRNTGADLNAMWRLSRLGIAWRHQQHVAAFRTSFPLVFWTLVHFVTVVVASILSSLVLGAGDRALSRSPYCGTFNQTYLETVYSNNVLDPAVPQLAMEYASYVNEKWAAVQKHVDICSTSVEGCDSLPIDDLPYSARLMSKSCPFNNEVCHPSIDGSMSFDTGYLSTMNHLGINAPEHDRMAFRLTAECTPLNDNKYTTDWHTVQTSDKDSSKRMADALYGVGATSSRNATYSITDLDIDCDQRATIPPYWLDAQYAAAGGSVDQESATFDPIPELQQTDADLSLMLLSFNNAYDGPVYDPWFAASTPHNDSNAFCLDQAKIFYVRDRPLTGLACTQQWQFCNTTKHRDLNDAHCTPPMGIVQLDSLIFAGGEPASVEFSPEQLALISRFDQVAVSASFYYVAYALSKATSAPLKARNLISTTAGLPLPATQWQEETKYWTEILLAYLQQSWIDFSTGQFSPKTDYINVTKSIKDSKHLDPLDKAAANMCANQIVRTTVYRNFNFFALMLTLVLGTIVIVLGLSIEDIIGLIRQRRLNYEGGSSKQDMWVLNSDIEMLKTISELQGGAVWSRSKNGVPIAEPGMKADINGLRAENYDSDSTKVLVHSPASTQHSIGLSAQSPRDGKAPYCYTHKEERPCAICGTLDHARNTTGDKSATTVTSTSLMYTNDFRTRFDTPFNHDTA